jgi:uncharacterized protein YecT (DUF1311 family)
MCAYLRLTADDAAFGYVDMAESDRDQWGAGPFANFCRVDVKRVADGFDVALRGAGCQEWCSDAHFQPLAGRYGEMGSPSFACTDPESLPWDEKIVCLDAALATLDREMAAAFSRARKAAAPTAAKTLAASQRAWLQERREQCNSDRRYSCVKELYQQRLAELAPK